MSYSSSSCTFANNALPILHAQRHNHPPHTQSCLFPPFAYHHPPHSPLQLLSSSQSHTLPSCSRLQEMPLASESQNQQHQPTNYYQNDEEEEEEVGISKIQVPRQKHISVPKSQLLDAILSTMFNRDKDAAHYFRLLTSSLDSILHAEHKSILEEMRSDYHLTNPLQTPNPDTQLVANGNDSSFASTNGVLHTGQEEEEEDSKQDMQLPHHRFNLTSFLRSLDITRKNNDDRGSRVTISTRFQCSFMQLLSDAQFEELSARDLMLTSALNTDYLLTLPVYVDWKKAYESNAIIFRRGYATEKQNGLLIVEKLDYLQSKLLQTVFFVISKPLANFGIWISEVIFFVAVLSFTLIDI